MFDAETIARILGGEPSADGYLCHCPVRSHGKRRGDLNPSLFIKEGHTSVVVHCFGGCSSRDVIEELRARELWPEQRRTYASRRRRPTGSRLAAPVRRLGINAGGVTHQPDSRALDIWNQGETIHGTLAETFLRERGITLAESPTALRFINAIEQGSGNNIPAMIAGVTAPSGETVAVQVTFLSSDGSRKADVPVPRRTIGALGAGATRFALATNQLGIAESTEKALAAMQLHNVPCWSALSASRMHRVWVPDLVGELFLFADNDEAGRKAVESTRKQHRHRRVTVRYPPERFKDWDEVTAALLRESGDPS
jgi:putative DNA primase/helicase